MLSGTRGDTPRTSGGAHRSWPWVDRLRRSRFGRPPFASGTTDLLDEGSCTRIEWCAIRCAITKSYRV
jgi:hypothetical protein